MTRIPEALPNAPSKPPSKPFPDHPSENAACPDSHPGSHLSESLLRNTFGTCHASRRLSRKTPSKYALCPRSPAESHPESTFETDPSVLPSESATCPRIPPSRENPSGCRPSLPPVLSAEAETTHPPEVFRESHVPPSA